MTDIKNEDLEKVLNWSKEKLRAGQEPPWAWYQYMKLREVLEEILASRNVTLRLVGEPAASDYEPQLPM